MLIYRICRAEFAQSLNASGFSGRWNIRGQQVIYASSTRSLAALELLANRSGAELKDAYKVMVLNVPDHLDSCHTILPKMLPLDWMLFSNYGRLQKVGSDWYEATETLLMKVPSVLIHQEFNYLLNTQHADFKTQVRLLEVEDFAWDNRLV